MILRGKPEEEIPKIVAEYKLKFFKHVVHRRKRNFGSNSPFKCVVN
jgi:hypothetical protein